MIVDVFKGHVYKFQNKIFLQTTGGTIGLELSGSLARLILIWFDNVFLKGVCTINMIVAQK